jgi:arsenate reductase
MKSRYSLRLQSQKRTKEIHSMKPRVLFLCTHNQARSQMAEALRRKHAGDRFEVYSGGLEPLDIHPSTVKVMEEVGLDISEHRTKGIEQWLGRRHFGYLITVCAKAEPLCPTFPGVSQRLFWPIEDPVASEDVADDELQRFREARDEIERRILEWLAELNEA